MRTVIDRRSADVDVIVVHILDVLDIFVFVILFSVVLILIVIVLIRVYIRPCELRVAATEHQTKSQNEN
jgi:hypothetical protein